MSRRFSNPWSHDDHSFLDILKWKFGKIAEPPWPGNASDDPAPWQPLARETIAAQPAVGWRAIWLGHASFLVQGAGLNLLIDPVFSDHCAPFPIASLKRLVPVPCASDDLPRIDAVLLTHGHYDHLDLPTLRGLGKDTRLIVADGHAGWLGRRGFHRVSEVPWWETVEIAPGVRVTATPAQHFTARTPWDRNRGHWCGWVIEGAGQKLWHVGDTAWCPAFREVGERFGPIDLGMIPIGAYNPRVIMRSVHITPEEAVQIFQESRCQRAVAMHWGTFRLTDEPMSEPPARLRVACEAAGIDTFSAVPVGAPVETG
ncbi:MBL fold metallo-hydrolase [Luteolibacter sp. LG18]|uniref:MBL fold metallo-hydrolase n=1 Tax=Luteolibacter sp. LG18 TaxID=2819286 RepID=UPI0030C67265